MASKTSGCAFTAASTSSGKIFSPPELIDAEPRPCTVMVPSGSTEARSPGIDQRTPFGVDREGRVGLRLVLVVAERDPAGAGQAADPPVPGAQRDGARRRGPLVSSLMTKRGPVAPSSTAPWAPLSLDAEAVHDQHTGQLALQLLFDRRPTAWPHPSRPRPTTRCRRFPVARWPAPRPGGGPWRRRPARSTRPARRRQSPAGCPGS